jgi:hypothetical protein
LLAGLLLQLRLQPLDSFLAGPLQLLPLPRQLLRRLYVGRRQRSSGVCLQLLRQLLRSRLLILPALQRLQAGAAAISSELSFTARSADSTSTPQSRGAKVLTVGTHDGAVLCQQLPQACFTCCCGIMQTTRSQICLFKA